MNGEVLKSRLLKIEPTLVEVAKKLQVSKQSLNQTLSATDIKTGFIKQLAAIYNRPIRFFFDEIINDGSVAIVSQGANAAAGSSSIISSSPCPPEEAHRIEILENEVNHLRELLSERNERIAGLKECIEELKGK